MGPDLLCDQPRVTDQLFRRERECGRGPRWTAAVLRRGRASGRSDVCQCAARIVDWQISLLGYSRVSSPPWRRVARLSSPACVTAWATLCDRDEILGEWMQEKVQSRGFRLCSQVPHWARNGSTVPATYWTIDTTFEMLGYAATHLGVSWFDSVFLNPEVCTDSFDNTIAFQWLWGPWIQGFGANVSSGGSWPSLSGAAIYTQMHMRFLEQKVDGSVLCTLSTSDLTDIGVPLGTANHWRAGIKNAG